MTTGARRPRRAVRPPGAVGAEAPLRTVLPAATPAVPTAGAGAHRTPHPGHERPADDRDVGWGAVEPDSNDDRLRRDRPPHWG